MIFFWNLKVIFEYVGNYRGGLFVGKLVVSGCKVVEYVLFMFEGMGGWKIFIMVSIK